MFFTSALTSVLTSVLTSTQVVKALEEEGYSGFCIACGQPTERVELEARNYLARNVEQKEGKTMRQMIKYANGEMRVIDKDLMIASEFLNHSELDADLEDYNLDCELSETDLAAESTVMRIN